jgi:hypothetical protein
MLAGRQDCGVGDFQRQRPLAIHLQENPMRSLSFAFSVVGLALLLDSSASACGGFFCGAQPVDQTAERILFEVGSDSVTMTTQISFRGRAEDFAWVLPLRDVPDPNSLAVFSQRALVALDAQSGPTFSYPQDEQCYRAVPALAPTANSAGAEDGGVDVLLQAEVGEYSAAVIASSDPAALVEWLRDNEYRITEAMEPYIELYTEEGLKFLALKLNDTADVNNLKPFRFTLPGTTPTIPLRMTALAAEPEMSVVVWVLGARRFEGKNWANLEIADDQIRFNPFGFGFQPQTNWAKLVAQAVDGAAGQGWVTEFAGSSASYRDSVQNQLQSGFFPNPEDRVAAEQLLQVLETHPYLTRLYSRLSAEEMTSDPVFGLSAEGDVARNHQLSRFVNGEDQCADQRMDSLDPCDFATCGAGGLCRPVDAPGVSNNASTMVRVAGCACVPGATARTTLGAGGGAETVCQDGRLSFMNPGDRDEGSGAVLPDPCAGFSCGDRGRCTAVNLTPTCVCDQGFVAIGSLDDQTGARTTSCVEPLERVPVNFYAQRLAELPANLPGGRVVEVPPVMGSDPEPDPITFPMPRPNPEQVGPADPNLPGATAASSSDGGCSLSRSPARDGVVAPWIAVIAALGASRLRRRSHRAS